MPQHRIGLGKALVAVIALGSLTHAQTATGGLRVDSYQALIKLQ
jgi:hypothetical protein